MSRIKTLRRRLTPDGELAGEIGERLLLDGLTGPLTDGDDGVAGLYGADGLLTVLMTSPYRCRWDEDCWEITG